MSVFALNLKFDLEQFDQSKVQVSESTPAFNGTKRGKFRGNKVKTLLVMQ